jgi:hypothetical protein
LPWAPIYSEHVARSACAKRVALNIRAEAGALLSRVRRGARNVQRHDAGELRSANSGANRGGQQFEK